MHALAIGYSPAYLSENADGIRRDWPRIPLPADERPGSVRGAGRTNRRPVGHGSRRARHYVR